MAGHDLPDKVDGEVRIEIQVGAISACAYMTLFALVDISLSLISH